MIYLNKRHEDKCSEHSRVELSVVLGHVSLPIVLVHLGQGVPVGIEVRGSTVPPHGEVLFETAAHIGSVRSRLGNKFVEYSIRAVPVRGLNS